jgi:ubiquinone/menaquinone biosynthesis C-methylase UbiE
MVKKVQKISLQWPYKDEAEPGELTLIDNVQFIYELALAELELESLGATFELTDNLRQFKLIKSGDEEKLIKRLAYFKSVNGKLTDYFQIIQKNLTRSVNQYLTHWIYPYKGKFHPQMIRALLNIIGLSEGDTVLDPFIGSGTLAVEAQLLGINCIGIDISPLCVLQSRVKTESLYAISEILEFKRRITENAKPSLFSDKRLSLDQVIESIPDERIRNFYKLVQLVAISDQERRGREFARAFFKNLELMISSVKNYDQIVQELSLNLGKVEIKKGDARKLDLEDESVDGIITSPPYSIALDYVDNDAHALKALEHNIKDIREDFIGVRGKGQERLWFYNEDMKYCLAEMYRVLKPSKFAVIIIGNAHYLGKEVNTVEFIIDYASKIGFKLFRNIDKIIYGLYNVMQKENILIFQKVTI